MPVRCQDCQTQFLLGSDGQTQTAACPQCGGKRLERDQPSPTHSDGDLRDMVDPATGLDQGGNPLGEGTIMGRDGERPFGVRDNSFVGKIAFDMDFDFSEKRPTHKFIIDHTGQVHSAPEPTTHEDIGDAHGHTSAPSWPKGLSLGQLYDDNSTDWFQHETPHSPDALASMLHGHFGTPVSIDPQLKPTTNEERWFGEGQTPESLEQTRRQDLKGDLGQHIDTVERAQNTIQEAQGQPFHQPEPPAEWSQQNPEQTRAYNEYVKALRSGEQRYIDYAQRQFDQAHKQPGMSEQQILQGPSRPRQQFWHPWENEGLVRGGAVERTLNMEPYDPWWIVTAELEEPEAAVPLHKAMVTPGPGGVHNGPIKWLQFLDAHVNGMPARTHNREIFAQLGNPRLPEYQQPVEVAVHHPEHLGAAIEQIEQAASIPTPQMREVGIGVAQGTHPAPPGIDPTSIRTGATHIAGPALALLPEGVAAVLGIGGGEAAAAGAAGAGEAAAGGGGLASLFGGGAAGAGGGGVGGALMQGALRGIGFNGVTNMMGGGQQGQAPAPQGLPGDPNVASVHHADLETPHSTPALHDNPDGDNHEFEDGSHDNAFQNPNVDAEAGGSAVGEDGHPTIGPNSGALERMQLLAPLLLHYYHSEESAINDPMVRELHRALDAEDPGYLDRVNDDDHAGFKQLLEKSREPSAITAALPPAGNILPMPATGPTPMGPAAQTPGFAQGINPPPANGPGNGNRCPFCGGTTTADGSCLQCGAKQNAMGGAVPPGTMPPGIAPIQSISANHQGPVTPEQQAAVAQLLIDQGRQDEVPDMLQSPADYSKEMAEVGHRPNVAPNVDPTQQPPPPPVQEVAPPGATMPMPNPGAPQMMASAVKKVAADSIARRCPNCGSATTGILNAEGDCHCHACGNIWKADKAVMDSEGSPEKTSAEGTHFHPNGTHVCVNCGQGLVRNGSSYRAIDGKGGDYATKECPNCGVRLTGQYQPNPSYKQSAPLQGDPNVGTLPAAEHVQREDEGDIQDSSHTWQTQDGEPLQKGHEYEMHSKGYSIPDIVRVDQVKPDGIVVTTIGEYSNEAGGAELGYQHEISHEESQLDGLTFVPTDGQQEQTAPPTAQNGTDYAEQATTQQPVNTHPVSHVRTSEFPEAYPNGYDPQFQQDPANAEERNEYGDFRVGDKWYDGSDGDLLPDKTSAEEIPDGSCPRCESHEVTSAMSSPETEYHECYRCGNAWETRDYDEGSDHEASKRSWVLEDGPGGDDFFANYERIQGMQEMKGQKSRDLSSIAHRDPIRQEMDRRLAAAGREKEARLAGKKFSPREQREFIDEDGIARNSDKLDLMGTHYESHRYLGEKVNGDNVPDSHTFLLGL